VTGPAGLTFTHSMRDGVMVLAPTGMLETRTYPQMRDEMLKCAAEVPDALVVDLDRVRVEVVASLSVFPTVKQQLCSWPDVPLLLAGGRPPLTDLLASRMVPRFVPTHATVQAALAAVGSPPPRRWVRLRLPRLPTSARDARSWLTDTCAGWGLPAPDDAVVIVSELVENAVRHARGDPTLRVELRDAVLSIAVGDDDPSPPRLVPMTDTTRLSTGGRGVAVIDQLASAWGHSPRLGGGKVVWAVLPARGELGVPSAGDPGVGRG
jgi:anti-sigma regulatory factor (Ser/Thr protein kinase)